MFGMPNMQHLLNSLNNMHPPALPFKGVYRAFPVAMCGKMSLEAGDKVVLPASALDHLARLRVTYPMLFSVTNRQLGRSTHCGVMEFSAEEGVCYLPYWMMQNLLLESGGIVDVLNVSLPKGSFVQLQPHSTSFTQLSNPRVVLERALRGFSCLTQGDTIAIQHDDQTYELDVVQVKPGNAISIIETDVNVDFKPPKDMPESDPRHPNNSSASQPVRKPSSNDPSFVFHAGTDDAQSSLFKDHHPGQSEQLDASAAAATVHAAHDKQSSSYFSKLGSGHKLNARRSSPSPAQSSSLSSEASSSTPTPAPTTAAPPAPKTVSETIGQWTYIYNIDAKGAKKLVRRLPAKKEALKDEQKSSSSSSSDEKSGIKSSPGYSLR